MPQPRKKRTKLKKLNITPREKWSKILKEVEKLEIPIGFLDSVTVTLIDGTDVDIDIKELIKDGKTHDEIEYMLSQKLSDLDHIIEDVDFYVNVDDVANIVQPITDEFLKDL